jgi:hypothetical protein
MKLAQTNFSKLRRSDLFVENRSALDSQLRRSDIFLRRKDVAPTELNNFFDRAGYKYVAPTELGNKFSARLKRKFFRRGRDGNLIE